MDATYSLGSELSGVGVYSRELLHGLAKLQQQQRFHWCYRPHRFLRSLNVELPSNCRRRLLLDLLAPGQLFHGLNQRLPRKTARRNVVTFHDLFVMSGEYSTVEFRTRFTQQARHAAERADLIICVSAFTASQVESLLRVPQSRLRVIWHGVHLPSGPVVPADAREKFVIHVGAIQARKNLVRLVEAFERMPADWRLVLLGSAGYGAEAILRRIASSTAKNRIEITGYVSDKALRGWYGRAAILAFPSLDEGFGIPILEAMAHGLPVLTSNRSALPEVAGDAGLLVDPVDSGDIAAGLLRLAEDKQLWMDLSRKGLARAAECSWERAADSTWNVYEELLRG